MIEPGLRQEDVLPKNDSKLRGTIAATVALLFVVIVVVFFPAARLFLAISIVIGIACAVILYFVNQRPVKLPDEENKRPLGL